MSLFKSNLARQSYNRNCPGVCSSSSYPFNKNGTNNSTGSEYDIDLSGDVSQKAYEILASVPSHRLPLVAFQSRYEREFGSRISTRKIKNLWPSISFYRNKAGTSFVSLRSWAARREMGRQSNADASSLASTCELWMPFRRKRTLSVCSSAGGQFIPRVNISIGELTKQVGKILDTFGGTTSLCNLTDQYAKRHALNNSTESVPLEHLISCITCVEIRWADTTGPNRYSEKVVARIDSDRFIQKFGVLPKKNKVQIQSQLLSQFAREAREIIMESKGSIISYNRFVPAYFRHYGRQCHVARLGFNSLAEILDTISESVQVLGEGDYRLITLSPSAQIRRFATVLLKILRYHPNRRVYISELEALHREVMGSPLNLADYGVCVIEDLLCDIWPGTIAVDPPLSESITGRVDRILFLPRPQRTSEEVARTRLFKSELIELLRCTPAFSMPMSELIPAYHNHFNRQCRVSVYGFNKLLDLLQSLVPHVIQLIPSNGSCPNGSLVSKSHYVHTDRTRSAWPPYGSENLNVVMSGRERSFALSRRLERVVRLNSKPMTTASLCRLYRSYYGSELIPEEWGVGSIEELLDSLPNKRLTTYTCSPLQPARVYLTRSLQNKQPTKPITILKPGQPFDHDPLCNHTYALPKLSPSILDLTRMPNPPSEWLDKIDEVCSGSEASNAMNMVDEIANNDADDELDIHPIDYAEKSENGYWTEDAESVSNASFILNSPVNRQKQQQAISIWARTGRLI